MIISVVIPVFNSSDTILAALESVRNQEPSASLEVIVVDDGSTDESVKIIQDFAKEYPDFTLRLIQQENGGVSKARNTGLKAATGDFIAFLDSDDYWLPKKTRRQLTFLQDGTADVVLALRNDDRLSCPYVVRSDFAKVTVKRLLTRVVGQTSTAIFRREVFERIGFFREEQRYSEDANLWLRAAAQFNVIVLNERLVVTDNDFGSRGLSSHFLEMHKGVRENLRHMLNLRYIGFIEFLFFSAFAEAKYFVRWWRRNGV